MDTILTSANNPEIKQLRKLLRSSKERRDANFYVAEGIHLAQSFLASGQVPKTYICAAKAQTNHEVAELIEELDITAAQKIVVSDSLFTSLSDIDPGVGVLIVFSPPKTNNKDVTPLNITTVLLEDVQDPGNLGTILRTAAAVGIEHILLSPACASPWSPKALRAGMGAQFSLALYEDVDLRDAIDTAKIPTIATTLNESSTSLYQLDLKHPMAWLFGNEGQGISDSLASAAMIKASIPQEIGTVESLNVAAAAAICLYEQYRQKISE